MRVLIAARYFFVFFVVCLISGCSGMYQSVAYIGEPIWGGRNIVRAKHCLKEGLFLVNPTVGRTKLAFGTQKEPVQVFLGVGEECRAPLPDSNYNYSQTVDFTFDVVDKKGELVGVVARTFRVDGSYGDHYRPPETHTWLITEDDFVVRHQ